MDGADFTDLPEGCVSTILSFTSPKDTCRSSAVSSMFRFAAEADGVWEKFLPSDCEEIVSRSVSPLEFSTKKELYFLLCDSILVDGGRMSFSLDKSTGRKSYIVGARQLQIIWGNTKEYWRWEPLPESRFSEVAKLKIVWWFDISGKLDSRMLSLKTTYIAYLIYKYRYSPIEVTVELEVGNRVSRSITHLCPANSLTQTLRRDAQDVEVQVPRERNDGWTEIELGNFYNDDGDDGELMISIKNINGGFMKSGIIIEGIELRPRE